ncbi:uncharacterized protein LOC124704636 [Lolium rigidum]|uniref:uncharacterized protein LOC124704636 n=1 Tax=Lolium rigidum TaxID=89674 RepID=UPI001F5D4410|nr:uncharacterized protein LOC124704636 [Lolium rigidum]
MRIRGRNSTVGRWRLTGATRFPWLLLRIKCVAAFIRRVEQRQGITLVGRLALRLIVPTEMLFGIALCANNYETTEQNALAPRGLTTDNCNLHTRLVLCQMIFQMDVEVQVLINICLGQSKAVMKLIPILLEYPASVKGPEANHNLLGRLFGFGSLGRSWRFQDSGHGSHLPLL